MINSQLVGPAINGAVTHPGAEKRRTLKNIYNKIEKRNQYYLIF